MKREDIEKAACEESGTWAPNPIHFRDTYRRDDFEAGFTQEPNGASTAFIIKKAKNRNLEKWPWPFAKETILSFVAHTTTTGRQLLRILILSSGHT